MSTHLTEDELVLHYYGELHGSEESHAVAHLAACSTCHESFRQLQRVLAIVDERALAGPELPVNFERTMWAKLEPSLKSDARGWWSWLVLSPSRLAWAGMVVVLVVGAFAAGRFLPRGKTGPGTTPTVMSADKIREGILLIDLGDHLDRSQMVLVELASVEDHGTVDISEERTRAEQLVNANRLYRQTALSAGDTSLADVLDDLERVLVDLAAGPEQMSSQDLDEVRRRIESKGLLFKVRVVSSDVRQRQRAIIQERASKRSSS
jgi:hypothetical protein